MQYQKINMDLKLQDLIGLEVGQTLKVVERGVPFVVKKYNSATVKFRSECITLEFNLRTKISALEDFVLSVKDPRTCAGQGPGFVDRMFILIHGLNRHFGMAACVLDDISFFRVSTKSVPGGDRSMTRTLELLRGYSMYAKHGFMDVASGQLTRSNLNKVIQQVNERLALVNYRCCSHDFYNLVRLRFDPLSEVVYFPQEVNLGTATVMLDVIVRELLQNNFSILQRIVDPEPFVLQILRDCQFILRVSRRVDFPIVETLDRFKSIRDVLKDIYDHFAQSPDPELDSNIYETLARFVPRSTSMDCITFYQTLDGYPVDMRLEVGECFAQFIAK